MPRLRARFPQSELIGYVIAWIQAIFGRSDSTEQVKLRKGLVIPSDGIDYQLSGEEKQGGSGTVCMAIANKDKFAIKFLRDKTSVKTERFEKELAWCKSVRHDNIIRIVADGEYRGWRYYIMPYYKSTLRDLVNDTRDADSLYSAILELCKAVKFVHDNDVIHRDLKPENILIGSKGLVLADFGIAHFENSDLTRANDRMNNANYAAPEQRVRGGSKQITPAADIYSLGLIINECFTKSLPLSSDYKKIKDEYPTLFSLDQLVSRMIKQSPNGRPQIDDVVRELEFSHQCSIDEIADIRNRLLSFGLPVELADCEIDKVLDVASEDLWFVQNALWTKEYDDLVYYNNNWHCRISYDASQYCVNLSMQAKIYEVCERKRKYEGNVVGQHKPLDLTSNADHIDIHKRMVEVVGRYPVNRPHDISGQILKSFSSCCDYHCREILSSIEKLPSEIEHNLVDAPILNIAKYLKCYVQNSSDKIQIQDCLSINWENSSTAIRLQNEESLLDDYDPFDNTDEILDVFKEKWSVSSRQSSDTDWIILFRNKQEFEEFRKYALDLAKPHHYFEGDVLGLVDNFREHGDMVELVISSIFEIPNTLAKILGLRDDY